MLESIPFGELSVGVAAIAAILLIVRAFLAHLKEKDSKFIKIIENHINHSTATNEKMIASHDRLSEMLSKVLDRIK